MRSIPGAWLGRVWLGVIVGGLALVAAGLASLPVYLGIKDVAGVAALGGIAAVIGVTGFFTWRLRQARMAALLKQADRHGLEYSSGRTLEALAEFQALPLFRRGDQKPARHRLDGMLDGKPVVVLDHGYGTGSFNAFEGNVEAGTKQTVAIFAGTGLPDFQAVPVLGLLQRPAGDWDLDDFKACGFTEIALESQELKKRYRVGASDPAVGRLVHGAFGKALAETKGWTVESAGGFLAFYRRDELWNAGNYERRLDKVIELMRALKRSVSGIAP